MHDAVPSLRARPGETILLVDDDEALRRAARVALQRLGYAVLEAGNGAAAVTLARRHDTSIHLLLSDVVMPHLGGRQLADVIVAERPRCRVLLLSGYDREELLRRGVVDAPSSMLQKPFTMDELAQEVRRALDG